jgi:hypothetical protein
VAAIRELNRKEKNRWSLLVENTLRHWVKQLKEARASGSGVGVAARHGNTIGDDTSDSDAEAVRSTYLPRPVQKQLRRSTKTQIRAGVLVNSRALRCLWEGIMMGNKVTMTRKALSCDRPEACGKEGRLRLMRKQVQ